jgi:hypothetical protein
MSEEQKTRQAGKNEASPPRKDALRSVVILLLVAAAFTLTYCLGRYRRVSRMDAFARCLTAKHAKMYGAFWCPHCADQEAMFESSFRYVDYVECGIKGSRAEAPQCIQAGAKHFPTWQFASGERREGALPLQTLGEKTGCPLP